MEGLLDLFGWVMAGAVFLGAASGGLVLAGLLSGLAGGGLNSDLPIPPGVTRRAAEIEARLRAHYLPRPEQVGRIDSLPRRLAVVLGGGPDADKGPAASQPLAA